MTDQQPHHKPAEDDSLVFDLDGSVRLGNLVENHGVYLGPSLLQQMIAEHETALHAFALTQKASRTAFLVEQRAMRTLFDEQQKRERAKFLDAQSDALATFDTSQSAALGQRRGMVRSLRSLLPQAVIKARTLGARADGLAQLLRVTPQTISRWTRKSR